MSYTTASTTGYYFDFTFDRTYAIRDRILGKKPKMRTATFQI